MDGAALESAMSEYVHVVCKDENLDENIDAQSAWHKE